MKLFSHLFHLMFFHHWFSPFNSGDPMRMVYCRKCYEKRTKHKPIESVKQMMKEYYPGIKRDKNDIPILDATGNVQFDQEWLEKHKKEYEKNE